ncbi:MAG: AMP-binding protein [Candidatus Omnitrophota bacterium]
MAGNDHDIKKNFIDIASLFKDKTCIESIVKGKREALTYQELFEKVKGLSAYLKSIGIKKGDRIAICLSNRMEWPIIFFASVYIGAIVVPLDPQFSNTDIKNILIDSGAGLIFIENSNISLKGFLAGFSDIHDAISLGLENKEGKILPFPDTIDSPRDLLSIEENTVDPEDIALLLYTSGTTSLPKGVMLTHKNLCSNCNSIKKDKLITSDDIILSILPLYHSYPLMVTLLVPMLSGAKIIYVSGDWPEKLTDHLKDFDITMLVGVPQIFNAMYVKMLKKIDSLPILKKAYIRSMISLKLAPIFIPQLRYAFGRHIRFFASGGARLDREIAKTFDGIGIKVLEGYGLTETSPVVSFNPLNKQRFGSVGIALPDVEVKVMDEDNSGIGELAIKGPNVMKGYYKDEKKTRDSFKDGYFMTGDLGYIDKDRYIHITGRSKEVIVLSTGKNIYPDEIEKHYEASPYVKEICVLGITKTRGLSKIDSLHAVVVPDIDFFNKKGELNMGKAIKDTMDMLSKELPPHKHVMGLTIINESLPRTTLGKLKRYEVKQRYLEAVLNDKKICSDLAPQDKALEESRTAIELKKLLKKGFAVKDDISIGDSIELDLGIDSLGRVELVCLVEKYFDVDLEEKIIGGSIFTVKDIVVRIDDALKKGKVSKGPKPVSWKEILRKDLDDGFKKKIYLKPGPVDYVLLIAVKASLSVFFKIFYSLKIEGVENIPRNSPYCLCVNHTSFLDGFIITSSIPFKEQLNVFFIGYRKYFEFPLVRKLVSRARVIPLDSSFVIESMQASYYVLKNNKALCVFPEGTRSRDGKLKDFKKGIGMLGKEMDLVYIPTHIKGSYEAWPSSRKFPRFYPIKVVFGKKITSRELMKRGLDKGIKDEYEAIADSLKEEVSKI